MGHLCSAAGTGEPRFGIDYRLRATLFGQPLLVSDASIGCRGLWLWSPQRPCAGTIVDLELARDADDATGATTTARVLEHRRDCFFVCYLHPEPVFARAVAALLGPSPVSRDNVVAVDFTTRRPRAGNGAAAPPFSD